MAKRLLLLSIVAAVVVSGLWFCTDNSKQSTVPVKQNVTQAAETGVTVGKSAPQFTLKDLGGNDVSLIQQDKVTVINFWATWCPPCRAEMPELEKFFQANGANVAFYAVNIQEPQAKVAGFIQQNGFTMPVLLDSDGAVAGAFRVSAIPTTVITDQAGVIRFRKSGMVTQAELEGIIKGL